MDDLPLAVDEVGVANGSLRNLSQLNLNNNKIGADGKKALAASKYLRDARVFSSWRTGIKFWRARITLRRRTHRS